MSTLAAKVKRAAKAVTAGVLAGGPMLVLFCQDSSPGVTKEQWLAVGVTTLIAGVGVYNVPNAPRAEQ